MLRVEVGGYMGVSTNYQCAFGDPQVLDILKTMRIGSLSLKEMTEGDKSNKDGDNHDPYAEVSSFLRATSVVCSLRQKHELRLRLVGSMTGRPDCSS